MKKFTYFTSEFVSPGHPDKVSDQISDAILDALFSRLTLTLELPVKYFVLQVLVVVGGEITTTTYNRCSRNC